MKECVAVDRARLMQILDDFRLVFDVVRLVDPQATEVLQFEGDTVKKEEKEPCFAIWEKNQSCENCVSMRACLEKKRITKYEFRGDEIYSVIAMPLFVEEAGTRYQVSLELANQISDDIVLQAHGGGRIVEEVRRLNQRVYLDSLTGVYNRRYYDENLYVYEMMHAVPEKVAFLVIDVNQFKYVNDTYGHAGGDELLVQVAKVLQKNIRKSDKVMRFGGDEFLIVLQDCSMEFVEKKIRQLKKAVERISIQRLNGYHPAISVGMAYTEQFDGAKEQVHQLCEEADRRMYEDKGTQGHV